MKVRGGWVEGKGRIQRGREDIEQWIHRRGRERKEREWKGGEGGEGKWRVQIGKQEKGKGRERGQMQQGEGREMGRE